MSASDQFCRCKWDILSSAFATSHNNVYVQWRMHHETVPDNRIYLSITDTSHFYSLDKCNLSHLNRNDATSPNSSTPSRSPSAPPSAGSHVQWPLCSMRHRGSWKIRTVRDLKKFSVIFHCINRFYFYTVKMSIRFIGDHLILTTILMK